MNTLAVHHRIEFWRATSVQLLGWCVCMWWS